MFASLFNVVLDPSTIQILRLQALSRVKRSSPFQTVEAYRGRQSHYPCTSPMSFTTGPSNAWFTMNREFDLVSFCDKLLSNLEHDLAPRMTFFKELEGLFGF